MHEMDELETLRARFRRLHDQRRRGIITQDEFRVTTDEMIAEFAFGGDA